MKTKIVKNYTYTGFVFPVELEEVEMVYYGGEWQPKIDILKLSDQVIALLTEKETSLTGDEVRFIRAHYGMSLRAFAEEIAHESHGSVKNWEDKRDQPTQMNPNTELAIRSHIIEQTLSEEDKKENYYGRAVRAKKFLARRRRRKSTTSTPKEVLKIGSCA